MYGILTFPSANRFRWPQVTFSEMDRLSSCAREAHDRNQQLTLGVKSPDAFLLKEDLDSAFFQFSHRHQAVYGVPGKPADGLGDDQVNLACKRVGYHLIEAIPLLCIGPADALVGINGQKSPFRVLLDEPGVVIDLRLIAGELLITIGGYPGVYSRYYAVW